MEVRARISEINQDHPISVVSAVEKPVPTEMCEHGVAVVGPTTLVDNVDAVASDGIYVAADAVNFNPLE